MLSLYLVILLLFLENALPQPTVSLGYEASMLEGTAGNVAKLTFSVFLSERATTTFNISYVVQPVTASPGVDYLVPRDTTLTIYSGTTEATIAIEIVGDTDVENTESFDVILDTTNVFAAFPFAARGYIVNDDGITGFAQSSTVSVREVMGYLSTFLFLSQKLTFDVSFKFRAYSRSSDTARNGVDYWDWPDTPFGEVIIPAGNLSVELPVLIIDDPNTEGDESFTIEIYEPNMFVLSNNITSVTKLDVVATIIDDDYLITISNEVTVEGSSSISVIPTPMVFSVSISPSLPSGYSAALNLSLVHITTSPGDFLDLSGLDKSITFSDASSSTRVTIFVNPDNVIENTETFQIHPHPLSDPELLLGTNSASYGTGTILDDDSGLGFTLIPSTNTTTVFETSGTLNFSIQISGATSSAGNYTVNVNSLTAMNTKDFDTSLENNLLSGHQTISWTGTTILPQGLNFSVRIFEDPFVESDEQFSVCVSDFNQINFTYPLCYNYTIKDTTNALSVSILDPAEVSEGSVTPNLVFSLSTSQTARSDINVSLEYSSANDTSIATRDLDYTGPSSVIIKTGTTQALFTVKILQDQIVEAPESVFLSISTTTPAVEVVNASAFGVIVDPETVLLVDDLQIYEGDVGSTLFDFFITSPDPFPQGATVTLESVTGTADSSDFQSLLSTTIPLPEGQNSTKISLTIFGDTLPEASETFFISLRSPNFGIPKNLATITIINDDGPLISVQNVSAAEASGQLIFNLTLDSAPSVNSSVQVFPGQYGSAIPGGDYVTFNFTAFFATGQTWTLLTVQIIDDTTPEETETLTLLFWLPNYIRVSQTPFGFIVNDDGPVITFLNSNNFSIPEGDSGTTPLIIQMGLPTGGVLVGPASVVVETLSGTAIAGQDFIILSPQQIPISNVSASNVTVLINGDTLTEGTETFQVVLSKPNYVRFSTSITQTATVNIIDDDVAVNINGTTQYEGNVGDTVKPFVFVVTFSSPVPAGATLTYKTVDLTASAPLDYTSILQKTQTFSGNETQFLISVFVTVDKDAEPDETFKVVLTNSTLLKINTSEAIGMILNDDISIQVTNQAVLEGSSTHQELLVFYLDGGAPVSSTVVITTRDIGSALAGKDYQSLNLSVSLSPGVTNITVPITINGDSIVGQSKQFQMDFSSPKNILLTAPTSTITIVNDDGPTINISSPQVATEGNTSPTFLTFEITAAAPVQAGAGFFARTVNQTADSSDFVQLPSKFYTFGNSTSVKITVQIAPDTVPEPTETFLLEISSPTFVSLLNPVQGVINGLGVIVNDDGPQVTIADVIQVEGSSIDPLSRVPFPFVANLAGVSSLGSVNFTTVFGTADSNDFISTSGQIFFVNGSATFNVNVIPDLQDESQETFTIQLFWPNYVSIVSYRPAIATISNDDATISVSNASLAEGATGELPIMNFIVNISRPAPPSCCSVSFNWATEGSTAIAGSDFVSSMGLFVFSENQTSGVIPVQIIGDNIPEPNESFLLRFTNPKNGNMAWNVSNGTIISDDLIISINSVAFYEGDSPREYQFPIYQSTTAPSQATVDFTITPITATQDRDFRLISSSPITLSQTSNVSYIVFSILGDLDPEPDEYFTVRLSNCQGCALSSAIEANVTLWADDYQVFFTQDQITTTEGNTNTQISISLKTSAPLVTAGPSPEISVTTFSESALEGSDFIGRNVRYFFESGDTGATLIVIIVGDTISESTEQFRVQISDPTGCKIGSPDLLRIKIIDNDARIVSIGRTRAFEGGSVQRPYDLTQAFLRFVISLSAPAESGSSLNYSTFDGDAIADKDYRNVSGRITFVENQTQASVDVPIISDLIPERDKTMYLKITSTVGSFVIDDRSVGVGIIADDDANAIAKKGTVISDLVVKNREIQG